MIGSVFSFVIGACLQYVSDAQIAQIFDVSIQGQVLPLNNSNLSASCANETLQLSDDVYKFDDSIYLCSAFNKTFGNCTLVFKNIEAYAAKCKKIGGQFYMSHTADGFKTCFATINYFPVTTNVSILNYPICAGNSCTDCEVKTAFNETISADSSLQTFLDSACDRYTPFLDSSAQSYAYNHYNGLVTSIIHIAVAILAISCVMYDTYVL